MTINWKPLSPNLKGDIPEADSYIADPFMVLRLIVEVDDDDFEVVSPAVTGRLERVVIIPDHNDQPVNNWDLYVYQNYVQAPESDGGEFTDTLDVLNGKGVNLPNNAITHLHSMEILGDANREPILPQVFIKDTMRVSLNNIQDAGTVRIYIYFYFSACGGSCGDGSGGGGVELLSNSDTAFVDLFQYEAIDMNKWVIFEDGLPGVSDVDVDEENGYIFADIDVSTNNNADAGLFGKRRWKMRPDNFGDSNDRIEQLVLEFIARVNVSTTVAECIINSHFVMGLSSTQANDNTEDNIAMFTLSEDDLTARTDEGGNNQDTDVSAGITITDWNKYKIVVYADGVRFYINDTLVATHTTRVPNEGAYIVFGLGLETNDESAGIDVDMVVCDYVEVS